MKRICILLLVVMFLFTGCIDGNRAKIEVEMWNKATDNTIKRYNTAKQQSVENSEALLNLILYNKYDESLEALFQPTEFEDSEGEGIPDMNFLEKLQIGVTQDGYDAYLYTYLEAYNIDDIYIAIKEDKEKVSSFLYAEPVVTLHNFFTEMNSPVVTEVMKIMGKDGATITVIILWENDKIKYLNRVV